MAKGKSSSDKRTTAQHKKEALSAYVEYGTVTAACRVARIGRRTFYDWAGKDPEFAAQLKDAREQVTDDLEQEAINRAHAGSDTLLIFLLKSLRPEVYRENVKMEHSGPGGKPIEVSSKRVEEYDDVLKEIAKETQGTNPKESVDTSLPDE
jgi:hypothetical protein